MDFIRDELEILMKNLHGVEKIYIEELNRLKQESRMLPEDRRIIIEHAGRLDLR